MINPILAQDINVRLPAAEWFMVIAWLGSTLDGVGGETACSIDQQVSANLKPYVIGDDDDLADWYRLGDTVLCRDCWRQVPAFIGTDSPAVPAPDDRCGGCGKTPDGAR